MILFIPHFLMPFGNHTLLLSLEGGILAFGHNNVGQLGLGHTDNQLEPVEVPWNGKQPVQVDWGNAHSLVLDAEGVVWDAGNSRSSPSSTFQQVPKLPAMTMVAAGENQSAAIDTEGGLWVWTSETDLSWASFLPQRVEGLPPLLKVALGKDFLVAEAEEGTLWVLGDNEEGQLGLGHTEYAVRPTLVQVEDRSEGPLRCLAALYDAVILIDWQGTVFSSGYNIRGQLGRSYPYVSWRLSPIKNIPPMVVASCGASHTLCLDENGGAWAWGWGAYGQTGMGNTCIQEEPAPIPFLKGISALVAGRYHSTR